MTDRPRSGDTGAERGTAGLDADAAKEDTGSAKADAAKAGATPTSHAPAGDAEALKAEVERLRKEKEDLAAELSRTPEEKARRRTAGIRWAIAIVMIVIGSILASLAVSAVWLDRTFLDTDTWVATVAPLATEPAIQSYVADSATNALFQAVDVQKLAAEGLPPKLAPFAPAIANAVRGFVHDQALAFTRSPQFVTLWTEMNRLGHKAIVAAVTPGTKGALSSTGGKVTLDIGMLVDTVKQRLVDRGLAFVANVPTSALSGRQITLFESPALAQAQAYVTGLAASAVALPIIALILLVGAVAVAVDRRKAVLWIGAGLVITTIVPLEGLYLARDPIIGSVSAATSALPADVAGIIWDTVLRNLFTAMRFMVVLGLVLWAGAVLAGPAKWAVALRGGVSRGMSHVGEGWDFGPFGEWVLANKPLLRGIGFGAGVIALLFIPAPKFALLVWIVVIEIVWLLLVELFGRPRPSRPDEAAVAG